MSKPTPKAQDIWSKCDKSFKDFERLGKEVYGLSTATCRTQFSKCKKFFANEEQPASVAVEKPATDSVIQLAGKYSIPAECIERGFQACRNAGVDTEYYVKKYILKEQVEIIPEVTVEYRKLLYVRAA